MKVFGWIGIILLLFVALVLSLPFFVDLNAYQEQYRPVIEQALNRKISLQDIRLTVWPRIGARVAGLAVLDDAAFGESPFTTLTSLDVGVKLMPLLSGRVEVEEIVLVDPVITVVKNQQGVLNVSTLGRKGIAAPKTPSRAPIPSPEGLLRILAMFSVDRVSVTGGTLTYRNFAAGKEYVLENLESLLTTVRLNQTPRVHVTTLLQPFAIRVRLDGRFGPLKETPDLDAIDLTLAFGKSSFAITGSTSGRNAKVNVSASLVNTADLPVTLFKKPVEVKDLQIEAEVKGLDTRLRNLSCQLFDGQLTAQGGMISGRHSPPFNATVSIQTVQVGPALEAFGTSQVTVSGTANADFVMQGRGFTMSDLTQALEGTGRMIVKEGKIEGVNLMEEVSTLFHAAGVDKDALRVTAFSTMETAMGIRQGVVNVERLVIDSHDFRATGTGSIGFDRALNLKVNLNLSEELSRKIAGPSLVRRLVRSGGRLEVPMVITGTTQVPSYGLDTKAVGDNVKEQVRGAVGELLKGSSRPHNLNKKGAGIP